MQDTACGVEFYTAIKNGYVDLYQLEELATIYGEVLKKTAYKTTCIIRSHLHVKEIKST